MAQPACADPVPAGLSFAMAVLRITYGGGSRRQMLVEGVLCGGLTLTIISGLEFFGLPRAWPPSWVAGLASLE